jgi:hypothetical protein
VSASGDPALFAAVAGLLAMIVAAIFLWTAPDVALFLAGLALLPIGIAIIAFAPAIFQESAGIELVVGGLILCGISAIVRELRARRDNDSDRPKIP